jgi:methyl-accepting chemotaxis protein
MAQNTETILIIFVAFTGIAVLLQACVLFAIFISLRKTAKSVLEATEDFKVTVLPMVHSTRDLVERITPQVTTISAGLAELTTKIQKESNGVSVSVSEIMERVSRQTARLDQMLTGGLNSVERAGEVVETAVAVPVRQVNAVMSAIRAVIETYRKDVPRSYKPRPSSRAAYPSTNSNADNDPQI